MQIITPANEAERLEALRSYGILDTSPEKEFDDLAALASSICGTPVALVTLVDAARQWFKARVGLDLAETPRDVSFCSHAIVEPNILHVANATEDTRFSTNPLVTGAPKIRFYCGAPLVDRHGFALGTLCVIDYQPKVLAEDKRKALGILAKQVVTQLELRRTVSELEMYQKKLDDLVDLRTRQIQSALKRIEDTYDQTLEALGAALAIRDYGTGGHSRRVTLCCLEIGKALGCSGEELKQIQRGAYMHDIGKIGIPDAILLKPGKLTPEERVIMEAHARIGYDLISPIAFLAGAAEIVLTHQERYDGTGYPQGLMGEEIPLGARIFSVADTLDAMTSDRPYRKALSYAAAQEEITKEAGRQFDPKVVEAFLSIPEETWNVIRSEVAASTLTRVRRADL